MGKRNAQMNDQNRQIRKLVAASGLSISELANKINASPKSIYKWMSGVSLPNKEHLTALYKVLEDSGKLNSNLPTLDSLI